MTSHGSGEQSGTEGGVPKWVALALLVVIGFFPYGASGLVAPLYGLVLLFVVWAALLAVVLRWKPEPRWWLLLVPVVAVAIWFAIITAGELWFDWTA